MSFDENKISDLFLNLSSANATAISQDAMDDIVKELKDTFMEPAKATGM